MNEREELMALRRLAELEEKQRRFSAQQEKPYNPTEGMGTGERFFAGLGKGIVDTGRGIKQVFNVGDQDQLLREVAESRRLDKALVDTTAGSAGNIIGKIAATAPTMFIPGANTITGGALIGAGIGLTEPSLTDDEALRNVGSGAAGGGLGVAVGSALPSIAKAIVSPFTKAGQKKIVGNVLRETVGDSLDDVLPKLKNPQVFIEGSNPNIAEATLNPKLATLAKAVRNLPEGREAIVNQEIAGNAARLNAIRSIAKDDLAMESAKATREAVSSPFYEAVKKQTVNADDAIKELLKRPSIKKAADRAATLAKEANETFKIGADAPEKIVDSVLLDAKGMPFKQTIPSESSQYSGSALHYLKMGLDDLIDNPAQNGIGKHELNAIRNSRREYLNWLENNLPDYKKARTLFAENSRPINQMEVGQALKNKLTPALTEKGLPTRERANMFAEAIRNQQALVKKSTGMNRPLEEIMTPEQMGIISGIRKDLERKANAVDLAASRGSDTAQNLIADAMLKNIIGPIGMPNSWITKAVGSSLVNALPRSVINAAAPSVERRVQSALADAVTDPKLAAELIALSGKKSEIARALAKMLPAISASGALSGAN